jgi:CHAD domain-containing protein
VEPSAGSVSSCIEQLVMRLRREAHRATADMSVGAIHDARVATRRVKAAMDLLRPAVADGDRRNLVRATRRLRRRFGPVRDLDVMIGHLDAFPARSADAAAVAWVRERARRQRRDLAAACEAARIARLASDAERAWSVMLVSVPDLDRRAQLLLRRSLPQQLRQFAALADGLARPGARVEPAPGAQATPSGGPGDPHAVRIAGKLLRYTLELGAAAGFAFRRSVFRGFKRLQDALGLWHDYIVMGEYVLGAALEERVAYHDPVLWAKLVRLCSSTGRLAGKQLRRFAAMWQRTGPEICGWIAEHLPQSGSAGDLPPVAMEVQPHTEVIHEPVPGSSRRGGSDGEEQPSPPDSGRPTGQPTDGPVPQDPEA